MDFFSELKDYADTAVGYWNKLSGSESSSESNGQAEYAKVVEEQQYALTGGQAVNGYIPMVSSSTFKMVGVGFGALIFGALLVKALSK